jgi:predicted N-acetyltransferase YhbS
LKQKQKPLDHLNRPKAISIAFDKIQHHFMIKALRKLGIEVMYLNIVKAKDDKPIANILLKNQN